MKKKVSIQQQIAKAEKNGLSPEDYYIDDKGRFIFTAHHHLKRGYCCKKACTHCPWAFKLSL
ncbi:MAG: DUF5522 domain-containing protein [Thermoflexibacteraceae bacterium]|jgi:hypothetical protein